MCEPDRIPSHENPPEALVSHNSRYLVSPWYESGDAVTYLKAFPGADRWQIVSNAWVHPLILCSNTWFVIRHKLQISDIAHGLCYLHTQSPSIAHGGLKGSNVFINASGHGLLAGFQLSKVNGFIYFSLSHAF